MLTTQLAALTAALGDCAPAAVAVSGGVDSMTLAFVAHRVLDRQVHMFHAVSPAVPPHATERVRRYAARERWRVEVINSGEFDDARYVANPANRCFFCKQNLYGTIAALTSVQLLSGTNLDDLDDWRPGLAAAAELGVRHPFVEAHIDKVGVRAIARYYGLDDIAELPAAPCLSSRVETGIPIAPHALHFIDAAEQLVRDALTAATVRCRLRKLGIVIELDRDTHDRVDEAQKLALRDALQHLSRQCSIDATTIEFAPYARGSAFIKGHA